VAQPVWFSFCCDVFNIDSIVSLSLACCETLTPAPGAGGFANCNNRNHVVSTQAKEGSNCQNLPFGMGGASLHAPWDPLARGPRNHAGTILKRKGVSDNKPRITFKSRNQEEEPSHLLMTMPGLTLSEIQKSQVGWHHVRWRSHDRL